MKIKFCFFLSLLAGTCAHAQFIDVDWSKVNTTISWLNSYNESGQLTLSLNGFQALKRVRPGAYFPPTKVPVGSYSAQILDTRKQGPLETFSLDVLANTLVVTKGSDTLGCEAFVIKGQKGNVEAEASAEKPNSAKAPKEVLFVNALGGSKLTIDLPTQPKQSIEVEGQKSIKLSPELLEKKIQANLLSADGSKRSENIRLSDYVQNGAVVVFHCDDVEQNIIRFSVFDGVSFKLLTADAPSKPAE